MLSTLLTRLWRKHWSGVLVVVTVAAAIYAVVLIWPISDVIAAHDVGATAGSQRPAALQSAREAARTLLFTVSAGFFAAGALLFTFLNFSLSRRATELTEQGQVTDQYTKAIEQLGSDKIDVRIGGIYALERIARDSARDQPAVMEVMTAFIREHSREQWPTLQPAAEAQTPDTSQPVEASERATRPDVQAAMTVVCRRNVADDSVDQIDLIGADLTASNLRSASLPTANMRGAILTRAYAGFADLAGANLSGGELTDTDLTAAKLAGASLSGARLVRGFLPGANLTGAHLQRADLTGATLTGADLGAAKLFQAKLTQAKLIGTNFAGADLRGVDLANADLTNADLSGADLSDANLPGAILNGAKLTDSNLSNTWFPVDAPVPAGWSCPAGTGRLARSSP